MIIDVKEITSKFLKNTRKIYILLPPGYNKESSKSYPVFYMNDGQNLFTIYQEGQWFKKWNMDIIIDKMLKKGYMEEILIVGIANTNKREYEYTPTYDMLEKNGGGASLYLKFVIEEVKPLIEKSYRAESNREHIAFGGSSLGGILSLYAGIKHSDVFSKLAVISPSLWWDFGVMFDLTRNWEVEPSNIKIWLDIGRKEGAGTRKENLKKILKEIYRPVHFNRVLRDILIKKGFVKGVNLKYVEDVKGLHDEYAWARRMYPALRFFFPKNTTPAKVNSNT
ncbi:MAG TPA: alpha/beta hydrolase-fold protein [Candidatus Eremiobacteraeota bacterium]|mgnify:CR=1 FL=1|nr:alpha/beta hydrolase-fold protein [Candidatus Eremiobacteraeota bacterium]